MRVNFYIVSFVIMCKKLTPTTTVEFEKGDSSISSSLETFPSTICIIWSRFFEAYLDNLLSPVNSIRVYINDSYRYNIRRFHLKRAYLVENFGKDKYSKILNMSRK